MIYGVLITIIIILGFLAFKKKKKDELDYELKETFLSEIDFLKQEKQKVEHDLQTAILQKNYELEQYYDHKLNELNTQLAEHNFLIQKSMESTDKIAELHEQNLQNHMREVMMDYQNKTKEIKEQLASTVEAYKKLEAEQQEEFFYTLQIAPKDIEDIQLLEKLLDEIHNKDILAKLIWTCYIQPSFQSLVRRADIGDACGIYKITNLLNKKVYIGKSTNIKSRLSDHIKSSLGFGSIADQLIHKVMREEGLWNFKFELLEECNKDNYSEREHFYIDLFDSTNWGYNIKN